MSPLIIRISRVSVGRYFQLVAYGAVTTEFCTELSSRSMGGSDTQNLIIPQLFLQLLADGVIPNEYGINPRQKLKIGSKVIRVLHLYLFQYTFYLVSEIS